MLESTFWKRAVETGRMELATSVLVNDVLWVRLPAELKAWIAFLDVVAA